MLVVGLIFITIQIGFVIISYLWPIFLLLIGWVLHRMYFRGTVPAIVLIPGGLFVISSLPLLYGRWFGWEALIYLWPLFLFGLAIGLYEYYRYSQSYDQNLFVASIGIGIVAAVSLSVTLFIKLSFTFIALLFVVVGFLLLRRTK